MSPATAISKQRPVVYPDSDGLPLAENTVQFNAIVALKENLEIQFGVEYRERPVAKSQIWFFAKGWG